MKLVYIGILLIVLIHFFSPRYKFIYYYSKDRKQCITQVEYYPYDYAPNHSYFATGHYDAWSIPESYIRPMREKKTGWNVWIYFDKEKPYLFFKARRIICKALQDSQVVVNYPAGPPAISSRMDSMFQIARRDRSGNSYFAEGYCFKERVLHSAIAFKRRNHS